MVMKCCDFDESWYVCCTFGYRTRMCTTFSCRIVIMDNNVHRFDDTIRHYHALTRNCIYRQTIVIRHVYVRILMLFQFILLHYLVIGKKKLQGK